MSEPYLGQIMPFAGNFAIRGWAQCDGQLLPISQNTALFSILGTMYGGDGRTTFGIPDLRGRVAMHYGNGPGLSNYRLGQKGGQEEVVLTTQQIPSHNHGVACSSGDGDLASPVGSYPASSPAPGLPPVVQAPVYAAAPTAGDAMGSGVIQNNGGGQGHNNIQPFQCVNWLIALTGVFPSRS